MTKIIIPTIVIEVTHKTTEICNGIMDKGHSGVIDNTILYTLLVMEFYALWVSQVWFPYFHWDYTMPSQTKNPEWK